MALIRCQECSKRISDQAASCPKCGYPVSFANSLPSVSRTAHTPNAQLQQKENVEYNCPYIGCWKKTPAGTRCIHCGRPIGSNTRFCGSVGDPKWEWEISNPNTTIKQRTVKPEPKIKIPWFAAGIAANQLRESQIKARKAEQEQRKQSKLMEETLKELKNRK